MCSSDLTSGGYWLTEKFKDNYDAIAFSEEDVDALKWMGFELRKPLYYCSEYDQPKYEGYTQYDVYDQYGKRLNFDELHNFFNPGTMFEYDNRNDKRKK